MDVETTGAEGARAEWEVPSNLLEEAAHLARFAQSAFSGAGRSEIEDLWDRRPFLARAADCASDALEGAYARKEPRAAEQAAYEKHRQALDDLDQRIMAAPATSLRDIQIKAATGRISRCFGHTYDGTAVERLLAGVLAFPAAN